jgi:hypothetical protein
MTKAQLIAWLNNPEIPDDTQIMLSSDEEGNSFHELYEAVYCMEGELPDEADDAGWTKAIILWP